MDQLNDYFWAWLEKAYQTRIHGTTKEKPRVRFANCSKGLRYLDPVLLDQYFLWEETRKVDATGCISLQGNSYELDLSLVKKSVQLRFNPQDLSRLEVWFEGIQYADALPVNLPRGRHKALPELAEEVSESTGLNFLEAVKTAVAKEQADSLRNSLSFINLSKKDSERKNV